MASTRDDMEVRRAEPSLYKKNMSRSLSQSSESDDERLSGKQDSSQMIHHPSTVSNPSTTSPDAENESPDSPTGFSGIKDDSENDSKSNGSPRGIKHNLAKDKYGLWRLHGVVVISQPYRANFKKMLKATSKAILNYFETNNSDDVIKQEYLLRAAQGANNNPQEECGEDVAIAFKQVADLLHSAINKKNKVSSPRAVFLLYREALCVLRHSFPSLDNYERAFFDLFFKSNQKKPICDYIKENFWHVIALRPEDIIAIEESNTEKFLARIQIAVEKIQLESKFRSQKYKSQSLAQQLTNEKNRNRQLIKLLQEEKEAVSEKETKIETLADINDVLRSDIARHNKGRGILEKNIVSQAPSWIPWVGTGITLTLGSAVTTVLTYLSTIALFAHPVGWVLLGFAALVGIGMFIKGLINRDTIKQIEKTLDEVNANLPKEDQRPTLKHTSSYSNMRELTATTGKPENLEPLPARVGEEKYAGQPEMGDAASLTHVTNGGPKLDELDAEHVSYPKRTRAIQGSLFKLTTSSPPSPSDESLTPPPASEQRSAVKA